MSKEKTTPADESSNQNMIEFFKQVSDHFKHLTTLSSGFILVMATMAEKLFKNPGWPILMAVSFLLFVVSIVASLMAQAYYIDSIQNPKDFLGKRTGTITVGATFVAWGAFVLGVLSLVIFALRNFL